MSTGRPQVVITGVGLLTSLGDRAVTLHGALCEGHTGFHPVADEELRKNGMPPVDVSQLRWFKAENYLSKGNLRPLDRTSRLAASAAKLALDDAGVPTESLTDGDVGLVLGTMFGSVHTISAFDRRAMSAGPKYAKPMDFANSVINAAAGQTAIWHHLNGINATISGANASGLQAIAYATDLLRAGRARVLLAGGADELCFESLYGFFKAGLLTCPNGDSGNGCDATTDGIGCSVPYHARRSGFSVGEAAALLVLERAADAEARGAHILAEIRGHGCGFDPSRGRDHHASSCAVSRAIREALRAASLDPQEVDCLSVSANGSVEGDAHEAAGIEAALGEATAAIPVTAVKSMLGETLGASGALQTVALVEAMRSGLLPGVAGLTEPDESLPLKSATPENTEIDASVGLVTSVGMRGNACSLALELWSANHMMATRR